MTQATKPLVVVGPVGEDAARRLRDAAASVSVAATFVSRCDDAPTVLASVEPMAIVLPLGAPGAAQACAHVRGHARFAHVPIFGTARALDDLAFAEFFGWGGDDLVGLSSPRPVTRRLRTLLARTTEPSAQAGAPTRREATAIVAGAEPAWRMVMGRALYNGGFAVRFATSATDLAEECLAEGVRIVVAADDVGPAGAGAALTEARARGSQAAWILVAPPRRMVAAHTAVGATERAAAMDAFAPPDDVLFLANELLAPRGVENRASARLLYGTTVAFRAAGRDEDEVGFSYSVSAGGVFVRTMAPLDVKQVVWLDMWAPRSERRVRLSGLVAWRRPFGPDERATVPPGFGVQLVDGLSGDLERWQNGYAALAESLLGRA